MSETLDRVSPAFVGEDRITIHVEEESYLAGSLVALRPITLTFNYSEAEPEGLILPLEIQVQPKFGDGTGYICRVYRRTFPTSFTFKPPLAGGYLILIRELFHNQWQGRTTLDVQGDPFGDVQIALRNP